LLVTLGYRVPKGVAIPFIQAAPDKLAPRLNEWLGQMSPPWIVRSSSNVEDSTGQSFAGVFVSVPAVRDLAEIEEAVKSILASASDPVVGNYLRRRVGDDKLAAVRMAILIQEMVAARVAGVAFSRDPGTGSNCTVIEASYGLGESVADGTVTPDRLIVNRQGEVIYRHLGTKASKAVLTGSGIERVDTSDQERRQYSLSDEGARQIAQATEQLEIQFGVAQDVEWAIGHDGLLYLLQCRPLTTGPQVTADSE
jgi:pyruvate, water dikinase